MKISSIVKVIAVVAILFAGASQVDAQATRTWISGVGDDVNPCSRTAPCKTWAGAIAKTAAGGEIDALDPGGFGAVTITKSMTLDGGGNEASSLYAAGNGINVNAGATDVIVIRNVMVHGVPTTPLNGINYVAGGALVLEHDMIWGQGANGVNVNLSASGNLAMTDCNVTGGAIGVRIFSSAGTVNASIRNCTIKGAGTAIDAAFGATTVSNSDICQNSTFGLLGEGPGVLSAVRCTLTGNATAVQSQTGAKVRLSDCDIFDNPIGIGVGAGQVLSANNNRHGGNAVSGTPSPTLTPF